MEKRIKLPEGVTAKMEGDTLTLRGKKGEASRDFFSPFAAMKLEGNELIITGSSEHKRSKSTVGTFAAHTRNMFTGVQRGFRYVLEIVHSHFPVKATVQGNRLIIENFIGEKAPRVCKDLPKGVKLSVQGSQIIIEGLDIEAVSLSGQKIEDATRIRKKDRRTFQDGIFIVERGVAVEKV